MGGNARQALEAKTGQKVVSKTNGLVRFAAGSSLLGIVLGPAFYRWVIPC
jgi:hypothetical protein